MWELTVGKGGKKGKIGSTVIAKTMEKKENNKL